MLKPKLYIPALLVFGIGFSQTPSEQAKIISSYNVEEVEKWNSYLEQLNIETQTKIDKFISENPSVKATFKENGVAYRIVDIIDGKPLYESTDNLSSGRAIRTNHLHTGGTLGLSLEGEGMNIALWDEGWVLANHNEFMNGTVSRVATPDSFGGPANDHGTHVGGTIAAKGVNNNAKGMAPKANLRSYDWTGDMTEVTTDITANALLISNHSYGVPIYNNQGDLNVPGTWYMGTYVAAARDWDQLARTYPYYLKVASAGNAGSDNYAGGLGSGLDKLTGNKNSKNILVVANANPTVHFINGITALSINPTSSQGPTNDGRIKPDIAADGTDVFSTYHTGVSAYETMSGTSMSSPSVAGTLLLIQEHYNDLHPEEYMKAATLKGLVCHTAVDDYVFNPGLVAPGPDPRFGWGMLDAREAVITLNNTVSAEPTAVVQELTMNQGGSHSVQVVVTNPQTLKASISWTDMPGTVQGQGSVTNPTTRALVNDLDIRIYKNDETYYPWKLDLSNLNAAIKGDNNVDNFERVDVDDAVGVYTIEIEHKGNLVGGPQDYSLVITGFDTLNLSNDKFIADEIAVYPNPANSILYFKSSETILDRAEVYDLVGKKVLSTEIMNDSIDISELNTGVYFVKVFSGSKSFTKKIIKK